MPNNNNRNRPVVRPPGHSVNMRNYTFGNTFLSNSNLNWQIQPTVPNYDVVSYHWTDVTNSATTVNTNMPLINKPTTDAPVTNEFIEEYFKSDEWIKRLHQKLDHCAYDNFRFRTNEAERQQVMLQGPREIAYSTVASLAASSKNFSNKAYDNVFFKKCITEFMARFDFVQIALPETFGTRVNNVYFNKHHLVSAITSYEVDADGFHKPTVGLIPSGYVHACPCCSVPSLSRDYYANSRALIKLTNSAYNRAVQTMFDNGSPQFLNGDERFHTRDHMSYWVCEPCSKDTTKEWFQCSSCARHDQLPYVSELPVSGRRAQKYCSQCIQNVMRDHLFVANSLTFQPATIEMPSKMRYVGCEFECYVKPTKIPKWDSRFVQQVKHDGSLTSQDRGVAIELVTQPLMDWRNEAITSICKQLKEANVSVDQTCGGHIHVDSTGLITNRTNLMRIRNLFRIYEAAFFAVCNKNRLDNSRYCAPVALDNVGGPQDNRYVSMNMCSLTSHNTIEFRCFDGSADAEEWLSRIAFVEGFINFAKESLNEMISTTDMGVLSPFASDSGYSSWNGVVDSYNWNRAQTMKELIAKNGPALINLAACRFKLKPQMISSLVKQYDKNWKAA